MNGGQGRWQRIMSAVQLVGIYLTIADEEEDQNDKRRRDKADERRRIMGFAV